MLNDDLFVFHDDNASFVDLSNDMRDYLRDDTAITFVAAEDALLLGLYKPFNQIFAELTTAQIEGAALTFEISNGTTFTALDVIDQTKSFTRSGFINWDRDNETWASQTINGKDLFWVRITADIDFTATFRGLNMLFADDNDLLAESPRIDKFLPKDETSFVKYHVSARDSIVQTLRNGGNAKLDRGTDNSFSFFDFGFGNAPIKNITKWDLLDAGEIRDAAKYLTLSKIYNDNSRNVDDKEYQKYNDAENSFGAAFKLFFMSIDFNDDGDTDKNVEQMALNDITVLKV